MRFTKRGSPKPGRIEIQVAKEGMMVNPFRQSHLRNLPCPCRSGKKVKKCCGETLAVSIEWYKTFEPWVDAHKEN